MKKRKHSKHLKVMASAALLTSGIATPALVAAAPNSFKDVSPSSAAYNSIMYLTNKGVINGFSDGTFRPQEQLTRGQAAKILALSLELNVSNVPNPRFKDVPTSHPFYKYIAALKSAGIIDGFSDGRFGVNEPLNRGQMVKILGIAYDLERKPLRNYSFTDVSPSAFYAEYLQSLIDLGITNGISYNKFAPNDIVNRGQMAMFVHRSEVATTNRTETISATISSFNNNRLVTNKGTFDIPSSFRSFFSRTNETVLKNAQLTFTKNRDGVTKLIDLEITNSGTTFNPLTLDGNNVTLSGNLTINADHVIIDDLNVDKNVTLGNSIRNSFKGQELNVYGTLFVNQGNYSVSNAFSTDISFSNSNIKAIQSSKADTNLSFTNRTSVESLTLNTNTLVRTSDTSQLTNLSLTGAMTEATVNASVRNISINTTRPATLNGIVSPNSVTISTTQQITLNNTGTISTLTIPRNGNVTLGNSTRVTNVSIPSNISIHTLINNYDSVKDRIERINGVRSSDYKPPGTPPTNPTTISLYSANFNTDGNVTMNFDQVPTRFTYTNNKPYVDGDSITYRKIEIPNLNIANGTYTNGQAGTIRWTENGKSSTTSRAIVSSSGSLKTISYYVGNDQNNVVESFTYTLSTSNKMLTIDTDFGVGADPTNVVKNSTYTVAGSSGNYITITGSSLINTGVTVLNEASLRNAINMKMANINVDRNITLTQPLEIDYPNVRIYSTNYSKITIPTKLTYDSDDAAITFTKNATNAKWQKIHVEGHKDSGGHGILSLATNTVIEDSEISKFGGFNVATYQTPSITLSRVKLTDSKKGGLLVNTNNGSDTTVNLNNIETRDNVWGGIELFVDKGKKITVTGNGNTHNDQDKAKNNPTPGIWTEGEGSVTFSLRDFSRYSKMTIKENDKKPNQDWYYQIDQAAKLVDAVEALQHSTGDLSKFNILTDLTLQQPLEISQPVSIISSGKTITLNADGDGSNSAQGILISSEVTIDNLNFTAGTKLTDNLIEVMGDGASLSLSNTTLKNSKKAAIYVGDSDEKTAAETLNLTGRVLFDRNVWGGVGAKNGATIDAMKATITINNATNADYRVYEENLRSPVTIRPVFWDDSLDVKFKIPTIQYNEYKIYKDDKGNRIKSDTNYDQIIYGKK